MSELQVPAHQSSLHHTRSVNLTFVQCECHCHTGEETVIARGK